MLRSLYSGVSGMRNNQVRMDVIGNNVANVNTVAFKAGRVTFKEGFAQVLQSATRPSGDVGGTNAMQVGLGSQLGSITTLFSQGSIESTSSDTDLAIQGDGFFVVAKGAQRMYTRAGDFQFDAGGRLVQPATGFSVQGRMAIGGALGGGLTDIVIAPDLKSAAKATTNIRVGGNLDASAPIVAGDTPAERAASPDAFRDTSIEVYDSQGTKHEVKLSFFKTADNTWNWQVDRSSLSATEQASLSGDAGVVTFGTDGRMVAGAAPNISFQPDSGAAPLAINVDFGSGLSGLTQYSSAATAVVQDQNGFTMGSIAGVSIDKTGTVMGSFTNGVVQALAQVSLASFTNPTGLERQGDNLYVASGNSGEPVIGYSREGNESTIQSKSLEMSNVDLAQEFTNMIVAQRGFQASSRVITTSDEMLQEVVGLKR